MRLKGQAVTFGDHVDTDVIIPARFLTESDSSYLARHCFHDVFPDFADRIHPGDIIVAGANFGCGSSREHAPLAIKGAGISCVVAQSFARIFYRNAFNIGLPLIESPEAARSVCAGDVLVLEVEEGVIFNETRNEKYPSQPIPAFMLELISEGGLVPYIRRYKMAKRGSGDRTGIPT